MANIQQGPGVRIEDFNTGDVLVDVEGRPVNGVTVIRRGYAEYREGIVKVRHLDWLSGEADVLYLHVQDVLNIAEGLKNENSNMSEYDTIPDRTLETINSYVRRGQQPGHFIEAVASNDLVGAVNRADGDNLRALQEIVRYFHNRAPAACCGSREAVRAWMKHSGVEGSAHNYELDLIDR